MHIPLFFDVICRKCVVYKNMPTHVVTTLLTFLDFLKCAVPFTELHKYVYAFDIVYQQIMEAFETFYCPTKFRACSVFPLVNCMKTHLPIVPCCGTKKPLFTNKLLQQW